MSDSEDAALAQALEAILAAKVRAQRQSWAWFTLAVTALLALILASHRAWLVPAEIALLALALWQGGRTHLRADALRGQALEKILAEAFRRADRGTQSPEH